MESRCYLFIYLFIYYLFIYTLFNVDNLQREFSKIVYQILSIVIKIWSKFITYILMVLFQPFSYTSHQTLRIIYIWNTLTIIAILWSLLCYYDMCRSICCYDAKNIVCIVFIRKDAFFKDSVWNQQPYAKVSYLPSLKGRVISIKKKTTERWPLQHEK